MTDPYLADGLWPRGMHRNTLRYDLQFKGVLPLSTNRAAGFMLVPRRADQCSTDAMPRSCMLRPVRSFVCDLRIGDRTRGSRASMQAVCNRSLVLQHGLRQALAALITA